MSNQTSSPSQITDPYHHLQIVLNPDGTLTRLRKFPQTPPASDPSLPISVLTRDVTINQTNNTWVRIFLPRKTTLNDDSIFNNSQSHNRKLPIIVFLHGSGFIISRASSTMFHDFCVNMADTVGAVVASVEYRLAPEHRLPAAYDDAVEALHWIRSSQDDWLRQYADYSNCYVMGNSAGATIAYHAGLRVAAEVDHLEPLKIKGLILRQPYFGGTKRSGSELRLQNDRILPLCVNDLMWELALPHGVDRDHEYSNPTAGDGPLKLEKIRDLGWRVLVSGNDGDPLADREKELAELMKEKGVQVVSDFQEEGGHGVEYVDPMKANQLIGLIKDFISSSVAA